MDEKKDMPDGIKWPRFKSGGPVGIGNRFTDRSGIERTAMCIRFYSDMFCIRARGGTLHYYEYGEPVAPAPVLAADGVPLEVGQTVYHIADGKEYTVEKLFEDGAMVTPDGITGGRCRAEYLTHQRPVLDADGKPLREDDMVWDTKGNGPYIIQKIENDGVIRIEGSDLDYFGYEFVHKRPDSWERIEEDAGCTATKYNERRGTTFTTKQQVARDLVRRCKELARKENNNE